MTQDSVGDAADEEPTGPSPAAIIVTVGAMLAWGLCSPWVLDAKLAFLLAQVILISIVIWQACDPFADAAQWVGVTLRLPGSVRGATLDAIASSMPELFSGIFFVLVAITSASGSPEEMIETGSEGYGSTVATCAGSAVYNMILIPAFCALVISFYRKTRPTVEVESEVIARDGMWFLGCQVLLIVFLYQDRMQWWMAVVFLITYCIYIFQLYHDAKRYQKAMHAIGRHLGQVEDDTPTQQIVDTLREEGIQATPILVDEIRHSSDLSDPSDPESAGVFYGTFNVPLTARSATAVLAISTIVAAIACYWLVQVTRQTAIELNVPVFFVAVILTAAASSVPDTFLSIGAAMRGDDSGAVSNAFGSSIFDICVGLSIPLLVNSYLVNWQPVLLTQDGKPIEGLVDLRILLAVFTGVTLLIMWHNRQLTRRKALVLCALYGVFIAYAVIGSLGFSIISLLGIR